MTTVRPYGDSTRDGVVQLSFTLPLGSPGAARRAALAIAARMNLESPEVVCCKPVGARTTSWSCTLGRRGIPQSRTRQKGATTTRSCRSTRSTS